MDRVDHAPQVLIDLLHAEADDVVASTVHAVILPRVANGIMRWSIDLDDQLQRHATIVWISVVDDVLLAEWRAKLR
jgi:hypothetical protein